MPRPSDKAADEAPRRFDFAAVADLLVCPVARTPLVQPDADSLVSCDPETRLRYQVEDGIPVLLPDSGKAVDREEWAAIMQSQGRDPDTGQATPA
ncbi:Trm112 family protein [Alienimonas sp. DA493]|uniref:Trm112 family protein n=1 Tax=Alienimonas sp. DA493 TaxID=3373605 RepID=UPI0037541ED9